MSISENNLISDLRETLLYQSKEAINLKPLGLFYFKKDFVEKCLREIETIPVRKALDDDVSSLEILAIELLFSAAGLNCNDDCKHK